MTHCPTPGPGDVTFVVPGSRGYDEAARSAPGVKGAGCPPQAPLL